MKETVFKENGPFRMNLDIRNWSKNTWILKTKGIETHLLVTAITMNSQKSTHHPQVITYRVLFKGLSKSLPFLEWSLEGLESRKKNDILKSAKWFFMRSIRVFIFLFGLLFWWRRSLKSWNSCFSHKNNISQSDLLVAHGASLFDFSVLKHFFHGTVVAIKLAMLALG